MGRRALPEGENKRKLVVKRKAFPKARRLVKSKVKATYQRFGFSCFLMCFPCIHIFLIYTYF